jgi:hypothetical protein
MLPTAEALVRGVRFFARRHGREPRFDTEGVADAVAHAGRLAADDEMVEPAALFFACSLRPRAFGVAAQLAVPFLARAHARALGLELRAIDVELDILRARVVLKAIDFDELRALFAARLRRDRSLSIG